MKKEVVKVAAWRKEFEVRSVEFGVRSEKARLRLNSGSGVLQGCQHSVSTPKQETANVRLADRSRRVPTFD